jgi:hypothetical protein
LQLNCGLQKILNYWLWVEIFMAIKVALASKNCMKICFFIFSMLTSINSFAFGGNTSGGAGPATVEAGAIRLLVEGGGLKRAILNYLRTIKVDRIEDGIVRNKLIKMMASDALAQDVQNSKYILATPMTPCKDAYNRDVPAATMVGKLGSDVCFDVKKLVPMYMVPDFHDLCHSIS